MSYTIAIAGKGGVGKTTVAAMLIKKLAGIAGPVLAVDADPNSNLNVLLGVEYEQTIADIREDTKRLSSPGLSKSEFFSIKLEEIIVENSGFDLLVMGRPEGPGCYCAVNNMLREYLSRLTKNYRFVVIDNEAGMEHLSRRTADCIDKLVLVSDPTYVSIRSAINAYNTAKKAGLKVRDSCLLINKSKKDFLDKEKSEIVGKSGLRIAGYISYDEGIEMQSEKGGKIKDYNLEGFEEIWKE